MIFTPKDIRHIVDCTNKCAIARVNDPEGTRRNYVEVWPPAAAVNLCKEPKQSSKGPWFTQGPDTEGEMYIVMGILMATGYCHLPELREYWSTTNPLFSTQFGQYISRDRFEDIMHSLRFCVQFEADENSSSSFKVDWLRDIFVGNVN